jgi:hypothetical protein
MRIVYDSDPNLESENALISLNPHINGSALNLISNNIKSLPCLYQRHSHVYLRTYLALENFSCLPNKSMALALLAKFIAMFVSKMEFFSVPAPNACVGLVLDLFGHFPCLLLLCQV